MSNNSNGSFANMNFNNSFTNGYGNSTCGLEINRVNNRVRCKSSKKTKSKTNAQKTKNSDKQQLIVKNNDDIQSIDPDCTVSSKSTEQLIEFWDANWEITDENNAECF
ncbi:hypothetical protein TRFO_18061 [Tritrichomonas foetus]|uniref:Uncharacterized protein n=1 Tax=Tritrichomonas foetus TaxID=1144522 RepID=A0A1J4KS11_9EUKA|nr:hypothetical protein TRFO_18061 [Tritrichomonas foetus]|eukprot:OHT12253.1 hypothetical protein TRFO_18061 [Tritrichomonas foetus]